MTSEIQLNKENRIISKTFIDKVTMLEQNLIASDLPGVVVGNSDAFPLKHSFAHGIYIREMFMMKDGLVVGKLHKYNHTWFLLSGELEIATDEGVNYFIAPCYVNAPEGTKRVIRAVEDSIFVNVFFNPDNITDIDELENILTFDSYDQYNEYKLLKE